MSRAQASRSEMPAGSSTALSMVSAPMNRPFPSSFQTLLSLMDFDNFVNGTARGVKIRFALLAGIQPDGQMPSDKTIGGGDDGKDRLPLVVSTLFLLRQRELNKCDVMQPSTHFSVRLELGSTCPAAFSWIWR